MVRNIVATVVNLKITILHLNQIHARIYNNDKLKISKVQEFLLNVRQIISHTRPIRNKTKLIFENRTDYKSRTTAKNATNLIYKSAR